MAQAERLPLLELQRLDVEAARQEAQRLHRRYEDAYLAWKRAANKLDQLEKEKSNANQND